MILLPRSRDCYGQPQFAATLKQELAAQDAFARLLQQAMQFGSCALLDDVELMINNSRAEAQQIHLQIGVFYHSIIAGCNCADDPSPIEKNNEYAEISMTIDRQTAQAILKTD